MRALQLAAAALLLAPVPAAQATTIVYRPHQPERACSAIAEMVANLNAGRLRSEGGYGPAFYSDEFGRVDLDEETAFLTALRTSNGRPDERPIEIDRIFVLDRDDGIYLVWLTRLAWELERLEEDGMLQTEAIPDPHYEVRHPAWIVSFGSGRDIEQVREADGLHALWENHEKLAGC
jgi:hypothetical protein